MKPELTQAGIEAAAREAIPDSPIDNVVYNNQIKAQRERWIEGANHVLSHLPDYAIGFAKWTCNYGWLWLEGSNQWGNKFSFVRLNDDELHAEYVKYLKTIKTKK